MRRQHKHWVGVVATDAPDIYDGSRITVSHTAQEADADMLEWLSSYFGEPLDNVLAAMARYTEETGRECKIEAQDA